MNADPLSADRKKAFDLLVEIVDDNYAAGRRSFGASVKVELQRRTLRGFDERRLGYKSFHRFLEAAGEQELVALHPHPSGPDVQITPLNKAPLPPKQDQGGIGGPIRSDIWDAFVTWGDDQLRFYDREADRAMRLPAEPAPLEPPAFAETRAVAAAEPERFVPIPPIGFDEQLGWMRDFAGSADPDGRLGLVDALNSDRPVKAFIAAAAGDHTLIAQWKRRRRAEVEHRVREWANQAQLTLNLAKGPDDESQLFKPAHEEARRGDAGVNLRQTLHEAIDRMSEDELARVWIPAGALLRE